MKTKLKDEEFEQLAREITTRTDFEHAAIRVMEAAIQQPPSKITDILQAWVDALQEQESVSESTALWFDTGKGKLEVIPPSQESGNSWCSVLESDLGRRVAETVRERHALCCPFPDDSPLAIPGGQLLFVIPCPASEPPAALAVTSITVEMTSLVQSIAETAATHAGLCLAMLRAREMQAAQQKLEDWSRIAMEMGHVIKDPLMVVDLWVDKLKQQLKDRLPEIYRESAFEDTFEKISENIKEADDGIRRFLFLGASSSAYNPVKRLSV